MPSDAFIGILSGLGEAHRARQKNIFDQEVERREQMAKAIEKLAEHPNITPEGAEQYYKQAFTIRTSDVNKKLPKEMESLATEIAPKFGQSWLGGQTQNKVEAQPMPIQSDLEGGASFKDIQGGLVPGLGDKVQSTRTPPAEQYQAPMPQPPPGATRSAFYSPQELSQRKIADAIAMVQALGPVQMQQALEQKRGELALEPPRVGAFPPESGIWEQDPVTRKTTVIREPELKPVKPPAQPNLEAIEITLPGQSGPVPAMRNLDPDNPTTVGKIFVRTPQGLQDVTAQAKLYQKPVQPPATIRIGESMDTDTWTNLVSTGQIELNDVPNAIARDKVAQEMAKRGLLSVPKAIREQITTNLEPAKSLISQVEGLANKIMRGEDRAMNTVLLQQQTAALGTLLGRMIGGERGVITDRDREVAVGLLPGWVGTNFAPSYVQKQMAYIKERLRTQEQAYRQGYFQQFSASGGEPSEQQIQTEMTANPAYSRQEIIDALKAARGR